MSVRKSIQPVAAGRSSMILRWPSWPERLAKAGWELVPHGDALRDERERTEEARSSSSTAGKPAPGSITSPTPTAKLSSTAAIRSASLASSTSFGPAQLRLRLVGPDIPPSPSLNLLNPRHP